ncbi:MAG: hypothetical protein QW416_09010 [Candidatus Nitrosocaldaceae archaeon]
MNSYIKIDEMIDNDDVIIDANIKVNRVEWIGHRMEGRLDSYLKIHLLS